MCARRQRGKNPQFYDRLGSASEEDTAIALFELQCTCLFLLEFQFYFRQARLILACLQKLEMQGHVFVRCGTSRINFIAYTLTKRCCRSSGWGVKHSLYQASRLCGISPNPIRGTVLFKAGTPEIGHLHTRAHTSSMLLGDLSTVPLHFKASGNSH